MVLSTKLFGALSMNIIQTADDGHERKLKKPRIPVICNDQLIRNLHYNKHGESIFGNANFLKCPDYCAKDFNIYGRVGSESFDQASKWFRTQINLDNKKLKLAVNKRYVAQIDNLSMPEMCIK
jgi:hypothetical protein